MNKQKKPNNRLAIVIMNFLTEGLTGSSGIIDKIRSSGMEETKENVCLAEGVDFPCSVRGID